jgi:hypothetical protein
MKAVALRSFRCAARFWIGAAVAIAIPAAGSAATAPAPHILEWVPNGPVTSVAKMGEHRLIAGSFTRIGRRTGSGVLISRRSGKAMAGFPEFAGGYVYSFAPDGSGGWFVGGDFQWTGELRRLGLAHVRADGSVDPSFAIDTEVNAGGVLAPGLVRTLAVSGHTLYAGGAFDYVGGLPREGLVAIDLDTNAVTSWNPSPGRVRTLAIAGDTVYIAGYFGEIEDVDRAGVAALDASTGAVTAWNPAPDGRVDSLAIRGDLVYLGGVFSHVGGQARGSLAAVDTSTGSATSWSPTASGDVQAIAVGSTAVYAGAVMGDGVDSAGRIDAFGDDGATRWSITADRAVEAIVADGRNVVVAGDFATLGDRVRAGLAEVDSEDGTISAWNPRPDIYVGSNTDSSSSGVRAVASAPSGFLAGGIFFSLDGRPRPGLAAIDPGNGKPLPWQPQIAASRGRVNVAALASTGKRVYMVGNFTQVDGKKRNGAAAFDSRLRLLPWRTPALDPAGTGSAISVHSRLVVVSGFFIGVGSTGTHGSMAAFDAQTGRLLDWGPPHLVGNGVTQVLFAGGRVYAVGLNGTTAGVSLLDSRTGRVVRPLFDNLGRGGVYSVAALGRKLFVGGAVQLLNGRRVTGLAAVDAMTGEVLRWHPTTDDSVFSVVVRHDVVYVGGQFRRVGGTQHDGIAAIDPRTGRVLGWNPRLSAFSVSRLTVSGGSLYALGLFTSVGPHTQPFLARFG